MKISNETVSRRGFLRDLGKMGVAVPALGLAEGAAFWNFGETGRFGETSNLFAAETSKKIGSEPTADECDAAIRALDETTAANPVDERRLAATRTLQRSVDRLEAKEFEQYFRADADEAARWERERGILRCLNGAFDKILSEVQTTEAPENGVVLWLLYNMGYVVKTPTTTFAIDIKHRRAKELTPLIDFLLITHKHDDHYTDAFCDDLAAAGKPVVSNFIENDWKIGDDPCERRFGDVAIRTKRVDHNDRLRKFVSVYEIDCGPKTGNTVVYHTGDACNIDQIATETPVDVFIPHLAVGLDVPRAVKETLKPKFALLSHILELGHEIDKWRWSYEYGYNVCKKCESATAILPVWGEKFVYSK